MEEKPGNVVEDFEVGHISGRRLGSLQGVRWKRCM